MIIQLHSPAVYVTDRLYMKINSFYSPLKPSKSSVFLKGFLQSGDQGKKNILKSVRLLLQHINGKSIE